MSHPPAEAFRRYDESPDQLYYVQPRFVTHLDEAAIAAVTQLYHELFPPGGSIPDLMSSWVSHPQLHRALPSATPPALASGSPEHTS
jgi:hypothetical protein